MTRGAGDMTSNRAKRGMSSTPDWPRRAVDGVNNPREQIEVINSLRTTFVSGGWLSTLVVNVRNNYSAWPDGKTDNATVQTMVEGFLAEVVALRRVEQAASAILRPARGDAPWLHAVEFDDLRCALADAKTPDDSRPIGAERTP